MSSDHSPEESAEKYFNLGFDATKNNRFDEAIQHYSKAIELNPKYAEPRLNRAEVYYRLRAIELCLKDLDEVEKNMRNDRWYLLKAKIAIAQGKTEDAIELLKEAKISPRRK